MPSLESKGAMECVAFAAFHGDMLSNKVIFEDYAAHFGDGGDYTIFMKRDFGSAILYIYGKEAADKEALSLVTKCRLAKAYRYREHVVALALEVGEDQVKSWYNNSEA